jgi:hypothetical protein
MMSMPVFVQVAVDPTLIPNVYSMCDQWCMYCPVTERCLAYRCSPEIASGKQDIHKSLAERLLDGLRFVKKLCAAEGRTDPQLEAILADDPRKTVPFVPVNDPIERMGRRYAQLSDAFLSSHPDFPFEMRPRPSGPTPLEVFAWYHWLIAAKIYRALISASRAARGDEHWLRDDAHASAKVALIGIDRSLDALAAMARDDEDARLDLLQAHLRRLRKEMEGRFPDARQFVRPGLDTANS